MRRLLLPVTLFAMVALSSISCKKDYETARDCEALATNLANAANAYLTNPSSENCAAYKNAINAIIGTECSNAESDAAYQLVLDGLAC